MQKVIGAKWPSIEKERKSVDENVYRVKHCGRQSVTHLRVFLLPFAVFQFNIKLPAEVDEYYSVKEKCMKAGWVPGAPADKSNASGPHRVMAQALMKRAIGDIPIVTFIQKESAGMNKLYSQSMCSVSQWRAYQNAEALVSTEVDEVRAEADEIEPGWSQVRRAKNLCSCLSGQIVRFNVFSNYFLNISFIFVSISSGYLEASNAISQHAETKARNGTKECCRNSCQEKGNRATGKCCQKANVSS